MSGRVAFNTPIALAFYNGRDHGSLFDHAIAGHDRGRWAGPYSHVELAFDDGQCFSSSIRDGGVRFKAIDLDHKWTIVELVSHRREVERLRDWCGEQVGGRYDAVGVLAFKLPCLREVAGAWFCSEICTAALQQMRHPPARLRHVTPSRVSPNRLYHLAQTEAHYRV